MYTTSRLIYPSRKSSVCLRGQLKFHSPKTTDISNNFSLLFCLVVSYTLKCNLNRKEKSNHCSPIEMNLKMGEAQEVLISAGCMSHIPSHDPWHVNALITSFWNHQKKKYFETAKTFSPNLIICFGFLEVFLKLYEIFLMSCNLDKQPPFDIFKPGILKKMTLNLQENTMSRVKVVILCLSTTIFWCP